MAKSIYPGRGIHKQKFISSLRDGNLSKMLKVINSDSDLDVQIRNDYLNIYYRGGNIARVKSEASIEFDMYYYYQNTEGIPKKTIMGSPEIVRGLKLKRDALIKKFKAGYYKEYFDDGKAAIDDWLKISPKPERMEQHQLAIENQYGKSDYTIIDLEYEVSIRSDFKCTYIPPGKDVPKKPRFDIVAVNKTGKLCIIELKKGAKSLEGTSGLQEHWDCYRNSIRRNYDPFINEMKTVLSQKHAFGLIDGRVQILSPDPEFIFAYSYDDKTPQSEQDKKFDSVYNQIGEKIPIIKLGKGSFRLLD